MSRWIRRLIVACTTALASWGGAADTIAYQGRIAAADGSAPTSEYLMRFTLHSSLAGGEALWSEQRTVPVAAGFYSVELGATSSFPPGLFSNNPDLWLETALDADASSTFEAGEVFTPRVKMTAAPYAFAAAGDDGLVSRPEDPNAPDGSAPRLGQSFEVGDGTVKAGSVVSLFADGKIRQTASDLPWAPPEIEIPTVEEPGFGPADFFEHLELANNMFVVTWSSRRQINTRTINMQMAGRIDPATGEIEFGEPVAIQDERLNTKPRGTVLEDGSDDRWPLLMLFQSGSETSYTNPNRTTSFETFYNATLTTINPSTLEITPRSSSFATSVSTVDLNPFLYPEQTLLSIAKVNETDTAYQVVVVAGGRDGNAIEIPKVQGNGAEALEVSPVLRQEQRFPLDTNYSKGERVVATDTPGLFWYLTYRPYLFRYDAQAGFTNLGSLDLPYGFWVPRSGNQLVSRPALVKIEGERLVSSAYRELNPDGLTLTRYESIAQLPNNLEAGTSFSPFYISQGASIFVTSYGPDGRRLLSVSPYSNYTHIAVAGQSGHFFVYRSTSAGNRLRVSPAGALVPLWRGLALKDGVKGERIPVVTEGIVSGLSGLQPQQNYYARSLDLDRLATDPQAAVAADGTLTTDPMALPVGVAISETELLLRME